MKRAVVWLALLLVLLSGCGGPAGETQREAMSEEELEEVRAVDEGEILRTYQRASRAWDWFEVKPMAHGGESWERDGFRYWAVTEPGFGTFSELETYLQRLFSEELCEQLLSTGGKAPLYRSIDGVLCVRDFGRERDWTKGRQQVEIQQVEEDAFSVNVTVDVLSRDGTTVEGIECWAFPYEKEGDRWVFTAFRSID